jgi:hypothetical protein
LPRKPLPPDAFPEPRLVDLELNAGIYTEQTARGARGYWKDADKVRFRYGLPEKIGGWRALAGQLLGLARRLWDWSSLDARNWAAIGTEVKLYLAHNNAYYDITPERRLVALTDPFDTVNGSAIVTVTDVAHGAQSGDYVRFAGATTVAGLDLDGEYQITVVDVDSYTITAPATASATASGGGSVSASYDISVGRSSTGFGTGWGTGTWSADTWGTPRTSSSTVERLRTWSLDNWGEDLIANPRGGGIYWWDRSTGASARATLLSGAPARVNFAIISQRDRHLFAMGATDEVTGQFDPLLIRWCSSEDFNDWVPSDLNSAGDLRIYSGSEIVTAVRSRGEIVVCTDTAVHQVQYVGGNEIYGITVIGENVSIVGPNAAIAIDSRVFLMAESDFYLYDGLLRPIPCPVRNLVYQNLNVFQKDKVFCGLNREFNEIWWFYPAKDAAVWLSTDFSEGFAAGYAQQSETLAMPGDPPLYQVSFNAAGYLYLSESPAAAALDAVYLLDASAATAVISPDEAEYEAVFSLNGVADQDFGVFVEATDLAGTAGTAADNLNGLWAYLNADDNTLALGKNVAGVSAALTNDSLGPVDLTTLPVPVTLAAGQRYGLILRRSAGALSAYLWDAAGDTTQLVVTVALHAAELVLFPGTAQRAGFNFQRHGSASADDQVRLLSFRAAGATVITDSTQRGAAVEVNRYVAFNYEESAWTVGALARTAWADRSPMFNRPYAAGVDSTLYLHETGSDANGQPLPAYIDSHDMEVPEAGQQFMHVSRLVPDFLRLVGGVDLTVRSKRYSQADSYVTKGVYPITSATEKVSVRARGRQISLRISSDQLGDSWRMGTLRAVVQPDGERS